MSGWEQDSRHAHLHTMLLLEMGFCPGICTVFREFECSLTYIWAEAV